MKILGYALMLGGFAWGAMIAGGEGDVSGAGAPVAALIGAGLGLLTAHSVRIGSIRGAGRRIRREAQPATFWVAVGLYGAAATAMLVGAVWIAS